jgi:hypothetical protein
MKPLHSSMEEDIDRTLDLVKGKALIHYVVSYYNIGVSKDLFNTSFASLGDAWILDIGATSHMKF